MQTTNRKIRVLVVDDSAVARSVIIQGLSASPRIEVVGYAVNAMDAKTKLQHLSPDVMTLDVEMPGINGIDFLKQFLPSHPLPVILVSSLNLRVFDALAAGAVDFVRKPDAVESRESFLQALTHKIIVASHARLSRANLPHPAAPAAPLRFGGDGAPEQTVIGLGASTGGTEATLNVLRRLPANIPGMVIVQHMPRCMPSASTVYAKWKCVRLSTAMKSALAWRLWRLRIIRPRLCAWARATHSPVFRAKR